MLGRNPLESYLSLKIARQTGQWMLTSEKRRKEAQVPFDATEFASHLEDLRTFRQTVLHGLQTRGQTAFILDYDDLAESAVLNGLVAFLGLSGDILPSAEIIPQNPAALRDKVTNPEEMTSALQKLQPLDPCSVAGFRADPRPVCTDAMVTKDLPVSVPPDPVWSGQNCHRLACDHWRRGRERPSARPHCATGCANIPATGALPLFVIR
jgi:hypothetical protein